MAVSGSVVIQADEDQCAGTPWLLCDLLRYEQRGDQPSSLDDPERANELYVSGPRHRRRLEG